MNKQRIVSGAQPSADSLHLGNYLGALDNWVSLQRDYDAIYFIADLHSITTVYDPKTLRQRTQKMVAQYLALGIDPQQTTLFVQSQVPEHTRLAWILSCITGFGEAARMTQFKDKTQTVGSNKSTVGLFTYPILMAADILLYQPILVPVGEDQQQHLELSRSLAKRFNQRFGKLFPIPKPSILSQAAKIYDLQNPSTKMSKSCPKPAGIINILDEDQVNYKKILSAVTDTQGEILFDPINKPGISNLMTIYSVISGLSIAEITETYANQNYGIFKKDLAQLVCARLGPIREKVTELLSDPFQLEKILLDGSQRARSIATATLTQVYELTGLYL